MNFHLLFRFLATIEGNLVKSFIELILVVFVTYMLFSEYAKDKRTELKYLIYGFGVFSLEKLSVTLIFASNVFGKLDMNFFHTRFFVVDGVLEILALVLLANAFILPRYFKESRINKRIAVQVGTISVLFTAFQLGWALDWFSRNGINLAFALTKVVILMWMIWFLSTRTEIRYRYRYSVIIAFGVYLVDPLLDLINALFYHGAETRLFVAAHPFMFLAVCLMTRVMYLRLVDKAYLRRLLKEAEKRYFQEKELSRLKDNFVSTVSHELRTPLTSMSIYTDLLLNERFGSLNKKQRKAVSILKDESHRLSTLINDILDLSKLEAKKVKLAIGEFDLHAFFRDNIFYSLARKKRIKLINKLKRSFIIRADPERFRQVLANLISNAIKYTDKGKVVLSAKETKKEYLISIKDTGRGISEDDLSKIFNKFYQIEHHMTRKKEGTGLGLTIANEIVKLHNGRIEVKSKLGKGSLFTIIIPKDL